MSGAKGNKKLPVNFKYFELFIQMVSLIGFLMYSCIFYRVLSNQIWVTQKSSQSHTKKDNTSGSKDNGKAKVWW